VTFSVVIMKTRVVF